MIPIEIFSHNTAKISIQAGQALFREGDEGNQMFILETGTAEVLIHNRVVEMLEHGNIVGEVGLVSPGPHSASVIAKTDCQDRLRVCRCRREAFSVSGATNAVFRHPGHATDGGKTAGNQQTVGGCRNLVSALLRRGGKITPPLSGWPPSPAPPS